MRDHSFQWFLYADVYNRFCFEIRQEKELCEYNITVLVLENQVP